MKYIIKVAPPGKFTFDHYYAAGLVPFGGVPEIKFVKDRRWAFSTKSKSYAFFVRNYLIFKGSGAKVFKLKGKNSKV